MINTDDIGNKGHFIFRAEVYFLDSRQIRIINYLLSPTRVPDLPYWDSPLPLKPGLNFLH